MRKAKINEDLFFQNPFKAINDLIDQIYEEKKPFLIDVKIIKKECESYIIEYEGQLNRINKNMICTCDKPGFFTVDYRNIYNL